MQTASVKTAKPSLIKKVIYDEFIIFPITLHTVHCFSKMVHV